ncbi:AAA family ATPase [Candidatus Pacearchaeota archaeon]|nr:AAA family ATPase [Candidatus Pacearchaeota archaeon]
MQITVSGIIGSGKSTVAKLLAEAIGYEYHSVGGIMREMATERGMHIIDLSKIAESNPLIDMELDARQKTFKDKDNFVMDSRLGFHFIPTSYRVFLSVKLDEAARRIHSSDRGEEEYYDLDQAIDNIKRRIRSEQKRYKEYYNLDFPKAEHFDVIIDTTNKTPQEVVEEILRAVG